LRKLKGEKKMDTNFLIGMAIGILLSAISYFIYWANGKKKTREALEKNINDLVYSEDPQESFRFILIQIFHIELNIKPLKDKRSFTDMLLTNYQNGKLNYVYNLLSKIIYNCPLDRFNHHVAILQQAILETSLPLIHIIFEDKPMSENRIKLMVVKYIIDRFRPIIDKKFNSDKNLDHKDIKLFLEISSVITNAPTKDILGLDYTLNAEQISGSITKLWDELETVMLELNPSYKRFEFKQLAA
jgi:hypothetical protein